MLQVPGRDLAVPTDEAEALTRRFALCQNHKTSLGTDPVQPESPDPPSITRLQVFFDITTELGNDGLERLEVEIERRARRVADDVETAVRVEDVFVEPEKPLDAGEDARSVLEAIVRELDEFGDLAQALPDEGVVPVNERLEAPDPVHEVLRLRIRLEVVQSHDESELSCRRRNEWWARLIDLIVFQPADGEALDRDLLVHGW